MEPIERNNKTTGRRVWLLMIGVLLLAACQPLSSGPDNSTLSEYQAQFHVTEVPSEAYPTSTARTVSGSVHGWYACTNGASPVPTLVWMVSKDSQQEYKDYQVREFRFEGVLQGSYDLFVGCYMDTPDFTHEVQVADGDLVIEIDLPFETLDEVYEEFGCLDCPPTPSP